MVSVFTSCVLPPPPLSVPCGFASVPPPGSGILPRLLEVVSVPVGPGVSSSARLHQTGREAPVQRPACAPKRTIQPSTGREAWMDGWMEGGEKGLGGSEEQGRG